MKISYLQFHLPKKPNKTADGFKSINNLHSSHVLVHVQNNVIAFVFQEMSQKPLGKSVHFIVVGHFL